ncbi:cyclodeaminase/cyclohydrolase family protein [Clostridium tertium]|jgi:methenyltetrahydrofolate cyclohydrolase|uniref:cyclodeaminase/cyclohydrolase family protein n=1 Tax=Clostridium TaxID=1485 RepID=UPI0011577FE5|nr:MULTISPECIES: cyclodeaminase/cyclohydrolase family protein [Clostridium]MDB1955350.1 cyclodeaminase/cyclohydrolase family protein [Clostridium tertium]MDB1958501.1 cyclodeaminase/cyclohydrolase family protein [Clostridium tertium]MDB1962425.1 cyclodeaminase/cyclohydrolase family protein [Clostridium tertium]MDB1966127.1 cyclodeaminase/cyclohydrolase family protein [Clostridium tertium]MDU1566362.1 cyclodeaminase/cyclohydrolase family protein [Clostridium sp.]
MLFKDYTVDKFILELSSDAPSPGGGSTAALVAALSSSLNSMVYSLTIGKKVFEKLSDNEKNKMVKLQEEAKEFIKKAQNFMEQDRDDFLSLMDSYKLPKNNEEEIIIRKEKIKENTMKAMKTPLLLAEECIKFYDNIEFAIKHGNKNLISDAGVATVLLHSAIESSIINVKVNLNFLKEEEFCEEIENKCKSILNISYVKKCNLMNEVENIIYPKKI